MLYKALVALIQVLLVSSSVFSGFAHSADVQKDIGCYDELSGVNELPLSSGLVIGKDALGSMHPVIVRKNGKCSLGYLEGAVVWDGKRAYPYNSKINLDPDKVSVFSMILAFGKDMNCTDLVDCSKNSTDSKKDPGQASSCQFE